jgi:ketosteroid isomerase-like protein
MTIEDTNMELFQNADDAWNRQDLEAFAAAHAENVVVYAPGQPPQHGIGEHTEFALRSFKAFPDQKVENRPYKVFFASGDWVLSIARYTGTMTGPLVYPDGTEIAPTGKSFDVDFATVGHWEDGQMIEEYLFYDIATFMQQVGLGD